MDSYHRIVQRLIPEVGFHQNHYANLLAHRLGANVDWLDLGAGTKLHNGFGVPSTDELASRARFLVGADPVTAHLSTNRHLAAGVGALGDALPFATSSFDVVTANMVVEHLPDPESVFSEVQRVLKPSGRFIFVTPNFNHPIVRVAGTILSRAARTSAAVAVEGRAREHVFPTFYRANTPGAVRALARKVGFASAEVEVLRNIPIMRRPAVAVVMECLFIRATGLRPLRGMGADLLAVLSK